MRSLPNMNTASEVASHLSALGRHGTLYYVPNHGNAGDSIIASATLTLLDSLRLEYQISNPGEFDPTDKIVVYGGGGGLIEHYHRGSDFIAAIHKKVRRLVILPHTIAGNESLLGELGSTADIFLREPVSYAHVKKCAQHANVYLAHDLALLLSPDQILKTRRLMVARVFPNLIARVMGRTSDRPPALKRMRRAELKLVKHRLQRLTNPNSECNCFRTDVERLTTNEPYQNFDLSAKFAMGTDSRRCIDYATNIFFRYLDACRTINTDRLHVCIAGALLGKTVNFYPNSYYKNQSIYQHSLADMFDNVIWHPHHRSTW